MTILISCAAKSFQALLSLLSDPSLEYMDPSILSQEVGQLAEKLLCPRIIEMAKRKDAFLQVRNAKVGLKISLFFYMTCPSFITYASSILFEIVATFKCRQKPTETQRAMRAQNVSNGREK